MNGWYVEVGGVAVAGPFHYPDAALMMLASYPTGRVVKHEIGRKGE